MGTLDYRGVQGGQTPPVTVSPDYLTGVIGQTQNHVSEIENRLSNLLGRIDPRPRPAEALGKVEVAGVINSATCVRNTASRIIDLVYQLENLI